MNKKYMPSALILYLNYFIHGIGCSILGQAVIKEALAASWGVEAMAITAISAALGLGRLIALPFAGPLSDKLGRRISTAIGSGSYAIYLIGLALAFNAGTNGGYTIAYVCAIIGGIANSFLDTGIYPAVAEIIYKAPGVATMGIKFFIAIAQMILPFVLGATVATTATGLVSYNMLFYICGVIYVVLLVLVMLFPLPDADQKAAGKKEGLIDSLKHTHFSIESVAMILIGFTCTGTFQLWLNCAQNFAKENIGWADPSIMQTYYSAGNTDRTGCDSTADKKDQRCTFYRGISGDLPGNTDRCTGRTEQAADDRRCIYHRMGRSRRTASSSQLLYAICFSRRSRERSQLWL